MTGLVADDLTGDSDSVSAVVFITVELTSSFGGVQLAVESSSG